MPAVVTDRKLDGDPDELISAEGEQVRTEFRLIRSSHSPHISSLWQDLSLPRLSFASLLGLADSVRNWWPCAPPTLEPLPLEVAPESMSAESQAFLFLLPLLQVSIALLSLGTVCGMAKHWSENGQIKQHLAFQGNS